MHSTIVDFQRTLRSSAGRLSHSRETERQLRGEPRCGSVRHVSRKSGILPILIPVRLRVFFSFESAIRGNHRMTGGRYDARSGKEYRSRQLVDRDHETARWCTRVQDRCTMRIIRIIRLQHMGKRNDGEPRGSPLLEQHEFAVSRFCVRD